MTRNDGSSERRPLLVAIGRGLRGRCPRCGKGRVLSGYISPVAQCAACGEVLKTYGAADFAPYLVTFASGLIYIPITLALVLSGYQSECLLIAMLATALCTALWLLPRAKGAAIGLLWSLDVPNQ